MILAHHAVCLCSQPHHNIAQNPVIHIHAPFPENLPGIDPQPVSLLNMIVQKSRQKIVGRGNGVKIPCKVQIQILHRHNLGITAAGSPSLDSKARPQGRLPQSQHGLFPQTAQRICQPNAGSSLSLPCRSGINGSHQHQLSVRIFLYPVPQLVCKLGLIFSIQLQLILTDSISSSNLFYLSHLGFLGNLNIGFHVKSLLFCFLS